MEAFKISKWRGLLDTLRPQAEVSFWHNYLKAIDNSHEVAFGVHLAIFVEPYLEYILEGKKTVESRFSANRCAPYRKVNKGDVVLLKRTGGPIVGISLVDVVWSYDLDPESWTEIKLYADALCATDPTFWADREKASYATLMRLSNVARVNKVRIHKNDRRGWVVLRDRSEIPLL